uniref:Uncharacterized protein n=1 Tax=Rhizochromulina marina TaxID=1034831 RepID=A0A7S2RH00_9STRA|mmetsp:Transcript_16037/g.47031  ORF Transcript_16037/g.47031 Transcript_16037/m.47031 type:complete len:974 (+) Transcript_16037:173-3094(+)
MASVSKDTKTTHLDDKDFVTTGDYVSICGRADVLHCCPSQHQCQDGTLMNRLAMASFAVVLLWMSSLAVAVSLVRYVVASPTTDAVFASCSYAYDVAEDERDSYLACVDRQLDMCNDVYDTALGDALLRVETNFAFNKDLLDSAEDAQAACAAATTTVQAALDEWTQGGVDQEIEYATVCGDDDDLTTCAVSCSVDEGDSGLNCTCQTVKDMIGDVSAVRSKAFTDAVQYQEYSDATVSSLVSYTNDRIAYDTAYVDNKTAGAQEAMAEALEAISVSHIADINLSFAILFPGADHLMGCVSLRDSENHTGCFDGLDSAHELYEDVRDALDAQLSVAREGFQDFVDEAADYVDKVSKALDNMIEFYEGFATYVVAVGIDPSDMGDWFGMSIADFTAPLPSWPSGVGIISDIEDIPGANYIWGEVEEVYDKFVANLTLASVGTVKAATAWLDDVIAVTNSLPEFSPDDYNPPQYSDYTTEEGVQNVSQAEENHQAASQEFVAEQRDSLDAFAEVEAAEGDDYEFDPYNFTLSDDTYNYAVSTYFPFEPLSPSEVDFNIWMLSIGDVATLLIIFDYVYRAYRSIYIFARFWSRSGLAIPDVDMRIDRDHLGAVFMSNSRLVMYCVTSPLVLGIIVVSFFGAFVFYVCQIYLPLYNSYVDGCVTGVTNGTFLTENLYSIAYNYAAEDGNEEYFNGIEDYNVLKVDSCASYSTSSQEKQNEDEAFLSSLIKAQKNTRDDMYLMQQCIDADTMDDLFLKACCGEAPYDACSAYGNDDEWFNSTHVCPVDDNSQAPFSVVSSYLDEASCNEPASWDDWQLEDAVFYCGDIPDCALTCGGPNRQLLRTVTEQCGCMVEWLFHSSFFKFSIALIIYILMNASRVILTRALCKVFWRYLSPGIFTYKATCDNHGNVLAPRGTEKYESFTGPNGALKKELDWTLKRYVGLAWVEVLVALALNVPWIVFLQRASHDIAYDPNELD